MIGSIIAVDVNAAARTAVQAPVRLTKRSSVSPANRSAARAVAAARITSATLANTASNRMKSGPPMASDSFIERDQGGRPVDPVGAVEAVRLWVPGAGDQREPGLVRAQRVEQPGKAEERGQQGGGVHDETCVDVPAPPNHAPHPVRSRCRVPLINERESPGALVLGVAPTGADPDQHVLQRPTRASPDRKSAHGLGTMVSRRPRTKRTPWTSPESPTSSPPSA